MAKKNKKSTEYKKTYFVHGMHCASCEILIEKELTKIDGVRLVKASLPKNTLTIDATGNAQPSIETLNNALSDYGYSLSEKAVIANKVSKDDVVKMFFTFLLFVIAFFLLEKSGIFMRFSVSGNSSLFSYFLFGLLASFSSCAALVGGLLLSLSSEWNKLYNGNAKKSYLPFFYFNISRVIAFAILGGALGFLGSYIKLSLGFSTILSLLISLLMLIIGFQMLNVGLFKRIKLAGPKALSRYVSDETNFKGKYMPVLIGALTFFVPCGFTLIAQTNAISSGSFTSGMLMLTAFSLGTLPILILISFSSIKLLANPASSRKFSLFSGMLIIFFALYSVNSQLNVLGLPSLSDLSRLSSNSSSSVQTAPLLEGVQLMQMEATSLAYYPTEFSLKANTPVRWEIYNNGAYGCAQAVYARGLYPSVIYLKPGLNVVNFTPTKKGIYKISCSMGMVPPVTVNVY